MLNLNFNQIIFENTSTNPGKWSPAHLFINKVSITLTSIIILHASTENCAEWISGVNGTAWNRQIKQLSSSFLPLHTIDAWYLTVAIRDNEKTTANRPGPVKILLGL